MAIRIPIVTEFNGKGISKAIKEFKQLETTGQKAQFALKKAAIPAAAAFAGVAAGLFDATSAAMADQAAQASLARQIQRSTKATDAQIAANEEWISTQGKLLGVTDDELRPALAGLVRVTKSIPKAQQAASLAMDIAAAKGISLETASKALERAYGGNLTALAKIAPELKGMIKEGASAEEVMGALAKKFGGEASDAANTTAGKFKRLKVAFDETKESIGEAALPIVEKFLPALQRISDWATDNPDKLTTIAVLIGAVSAAILVMTGALGAWNLVAGITAALNTALATSFTAIQVASGMIVFTALIAGIALAYSKFEWFRDGVKAIVNGLISYFEILINSWIMVINGLIRAYNIIPGHKDIKTLSHITLGRVGQTQPMESSAANFRMFDQANPGPSVPEITASKKSSSAGINITVQTGVGDPAAIGKAVSQTLDAYGRRAA